MRKSAKCFVHFDFSSVVTANTGQLSAVLKALARAKTYDVRIAPLGAGGTPGTWVTTTVSNAKTAVLLGNLTPGTTYSVQVRGFNKLGYSDWSASVERMVI